VGSGSGKPSLGQHDLVDVSSEREHVDKLIRDPLAIDAAEAPRVPPGSENL